MAVPEIVEGQLGGRRTMRKEVAHELADWVLNETEILSLVTTK